MSTTVILIVAAVLLITNINAFVFMANDKKKAKIGRAHV